MEHVVGCLALILNTSAGNRTDGVARRHGGNVGKGSSQNFCCRPIMVATPQVSLPGRTRVIRSRVLAGPRRQAQRRASNAAPRFDLRRQPRV